MAHFAIIELDEGLTIVEIPPGEKIEGVAAARGGVLIDPGPYPSYDEACEALVALQTEEDENRE